MEKKVVFGITLKAYKVVWVTEGIYMMFLKVPAEAFWLQL